MSNEIKNKKFNWKLFHELTSDQIITNPENKGILDEILNYKIKDFEVDNLPSYFIVNFINVLQEYIKLFHNKKQMTDKNERAKRKIIMDNYFELQVKNEDNEKCNESIEIQKYQQQILDYKQQLNDLKLKYSIKIKSYKKALTEKDNKFQDMEKKLEKTKTELIQLIFKNKTENIEEDINQKNRIALTESNMTYEDKKSSIYDSKTQESFQGLNENLNNIFKKLKEQEKINGLKFKNIENKLGHMRNSFGNEVTKYSISTKNVRTFHSFQLKSQAMMVKTNDNV